MSTADQNPETTDRDASSSRLPKAVYDAELRRLQSELVVMQDWVARTGARIVVIFEGRDAAGKGGAIKRITEYLNPRHVRVMALNRPTRPEKTQWYFQRFVAHLPSAGEIVLMDRSWYNRAGVERVMGFCTDDEYQRFLDQVPTFEKMLIDDGIILVKYWFSVSDAEQERRMQDRLSDPLRRWKFSDMDVEARERWEEFSKAKDTMMARTDTKFSPWWTVEADDKRAARLNCIAHLLTQIPYEHLEPKIAELPARPACRAKSRRPLNGKVVPDLTAVLLGKRR